MHSMPDSRQCGEPIAPARRHRRRRMSRSHARRARASRWRCNHSPRAAIDALALQIHGPLPSVEQNSHCRRAAGRAGGGSKYGASQGYCRANCLDKRRERCTASGLTNTHQLACSLPGRCTFVSPAPGQREGSGTLKARSFVRKVSRSAPGGGGASALNRRAQLLFYNKHKK